jgi:hypothetical protein
MISTLVSEGRQNNCILVIYTTRKRLAYGCLCMLLPKHTVSSRDQCVVIGIMTGKETTVLTGLLQYNLIYFGA